MKNFIDLNTLTLAILLITLFMGVIIIVFGVSWKNSVNGITRTGTSLIVISFALGLDTFLPFFSHQPVIITLSTLLTLLAMSNIYGGIAEYHKKKIHLTAHILLLSLIILSSVYFGIIKENSRIRLIIFSFAVAMYAFGSGLLFLRDIPHYNKRHHLILGIVFLLLMVLNGYRLVFLILYPDYTSVITYPLVQIIYLTGSILLILTSGIGLIALVNRQILSLRDQLLAVMAHDIKNPLNTIIGYAEVIRQTHLTDETITSYLDQIRHASNKSLELINNMLEWTRVSFQQITPHYSSIDLDPLINDLISFYTPSATIRGQKILYEGTKGLSLFSDPMFIHTILRNLISNALKYSPNNSSIRITSEMQQNNLYLAVEDEGPGVAEDLIQAIRQGKIQPSNFSQDKSGSGLGLYLCASYIQLLNGSLEIANQQKGCRFTLILPV
ncbi:MAG: HAMP domain-containing histidine kinase [Bacteroidia bacterium]|nr:HAMP domain-containing histidine kinase [Bacteroidia bacterium]